MTGKASPATEAGIRRSVRAAVGTFLGIVGWSVVVEVLRVDIGAAFLVLLIIMVTGFGVMVVVDVR